MTIHVSIKEAKNRLSELRRRARDGERVIVTVNGVPDFEITPVKKKGGIDFEGIERWKRENGIKAMAGPYEGDFDEPLPEDFLSTPWNEIMERFGKK